MSISFSGGKRYRRHNGFFENAEIKTPIASPVHLYNLRQGKNLLLRPIVEVGDRVLRGEKIADLDAFSAIPCIASVSGRVFSLENECITIENDYLDDSVPPLSPQKTADTMTSRELLWLMREGGVVEPRTGIPLHVMLSQGKVPESIIVCCFDSDPYVSSAQTAACGNAEKIFFALGIALRLLCIKKAFIAVESTCGRLYSDFKQLLRYNKNIMLYSLKPRYPQSRSDVLIKTVVGSADTQAMVLSAEALCNLSDALSLKPVLEKLVTVSGDDILEPANYRVPLGATISSLITSAGYTAPQTVIAGGITDGKLVTDLDTPITAVTSAVLAFNDNKNIPKYRQELI